MTVPNHQALDCLFARLAGNAAPEPAEAECLPDSSLAAMPDEPAPAIRSEADLQIATQWLQRERQRLEAYTRAQVARIQQEHQALIQQNYLHEQALILRSQEQARKEEMLLAHGRELQQRTQDLSQREQALAAQLHQWWQANADLATLQKATDEAQKDAAQHQVLVEALKTETAALQQARETALAELRSLTASSEEVRQTRAKEAATWKARQAQLEQRMVEAEKALRAADQRQAELDDVECRLRREFEEQERQLRRDRGELTALEKRLRAAQAELDIERMRQRERELDEWQATLTQLHTDLEEQWRDLQRRNAELHQQEVVLRKGWQDLPPRRAEQGGLNRSGHRATWEASSHLSG